jgi:serine/arginine repetitive matrix protein 2
VEHVTTPPATDSDRRLSEHLSLVDEEIAGPPEEDANDVRVRVKSEASLLPPSAGLTRSSYMTSSTNGSRMSNLSDFPTPPMGAHIKLFDSFFAPRGDDIGREEREERLEQDEGQGSEREQEREGTSDSPQAPVSRRMTFGGDEDIEDIAKSLSSPRRESIDD